MPRRFATPICATFFVEHAEHSDQKFRWPLRIRLRAWRARQLGRPSQAPGRQHRRIRHFLAERLARVGPIRCRENSRRSDPILFDDSEQLKRISTVEAISRALVRAKADRHAIIVAIGGGVVGDVVGFVAASDPRGVKLVHVPTTLVAQVDSSIGGKTGVNMSEGKNLVGAFYPPELILADPNVLQTLPHREFRSGLYEVVKYGVIADLNLFGFLEKRMPAVLRRDPDSLGRIIPRCAGIKADVVNKDEREGGLRHILNFGHTIGHGLEAITGYKRFLHGEAIGWGIISATLISVAMDHLSKDYAVRIIRLSPASARCRRLENSGCRSPPDFSRRQESAWRARIMGAPNAYRQNQMGHRRSLERRFACLP